MDIIKVKDEKLRQKLRKPLGILIKSFSEVLKEAKEARLKGLQIISVGDRTTINFISNGFLPDISVVNGKEMRREAPKIREDLFKSVFTVRNPRGSINLEITSMFNRFLSSKPSLVRVIGEEDLLTLLFCVFFPKESVVFYGQPNRGVVMVKLTKTKKQELKKLFQKIIESQTTEGKQK